MIEYVSIFIFGILALLVGCIMLFANALWGPRRPSRVKSEPFECGKDPIALPAGRIPIHFYVVAMLFVVFDVEVAFLFPWAVLAKELGWFGFFEVLFFIAVVVAGFLYAWNQGALDLIAQKRTKRTRAASP